MPSIHIDGIVSFSSNNGVWVHEKALAATPRELFEAIEKAYAHIKDPPLLLACGGAMGPLAKFSDLTFERYLEELRLIEIAEAGAGAKRSLTRQRRDEFNTQRSHLQLALLDSGVPYICSTPGCGVTKDLTIDHITALSRGGTDALENLRFMCRSQNSKKGTARDA